MEAALRCQPHALGPLQGGPLAEQERRRLTGNVWQFFSGMQYYEPRLPCDHTQIGRFRRVLGEAGVEQLLKTTIEAAV